MFKPMHDMINHQIKPWAPLFSLMLVIGLKFEFLTARIPIWDSWNLEENVFPCAPDLNQLWMEIGGKENHI